MNANGGLGLLLRPRFSEYRFNLISSASMRTGEFSALVARLEPVSSPSIVSRSRWRMKVQVDYSVRGLDLFNVKSTE